MWSPTAGISPWSATAIPISAPISPGNSGGPVMQDAKVVGVAFQGYSGDVAQGVAYMIPTPVINRFLKDVSNGHYDEYPDMAITYSKLQNPAQRRFLCTNHGHTRSRAIATMSARVTSFTAAYFFNP